MKLSYVPLLSRTVRPQLDHMRVQQIVGRVVITMRILNAGEASYPDGWVGYQAVASYDRRRWFRVPTSYGDGVLTISHRPQHDSVYYAYWNSPIYGSRRKRKLL